MKVKMLVEFDYDETVAYGNDLGARKWFFESILGGDDLILHSQEIGDEIGTIKVLKILEGKDNGVNDDT